MNQLGLNHREIEEFCQKNFISYMALFGSFARGEATNKSDVDVVVRFDRDDISLFDHIEIEDNFSKLLGRGVDMLTERSISPFLKENITSDLTVIYEKEN